MRRTLYLSAFALLALSVATSCNDNKRAKNYNEQTTVDDQALDFIKSTYKTGLAEIKAAKIAQANSKNPRVLGFAKMIIVDHSTADSELKKLADKKYITFSDTIIELSHQNMLDSIAELQGQAFDVAYINMMVNDNDTTIRMFEDATGNHTKAVRNFAKKTLPVLKMHQDSAQAIAKSIK
ncbi:DUF4142 domain-containing protein [Mucilaginibacter terrae]|uniref:Membrane protein n=1 Tax=Mucilaginibacter terrae TaxID=1955052 RepID=A0ABU3GNY7_9SPHI|nr:DUF4142 domain-containing protein [Mucilaginibacter terrae]MDT3401488.1 putative membrane protein [Mucilaginibacter terrae]